MRSFYLITLLAFASAASAQEVAEPHVGTVEPRLSGFALPVVGPEQQAHQLFAVTVGDEPTTYTSPIVMGAGMAQQLRMEVSVPADESTTCSLLVRYGVEGDIRQMDLGEAATIDLLDAVDARILADTMKDQANADELRNRVAVRLIDAIAAERAQVDAELAVQREDRLRQIDAKTPVRDREDTGTRDGGTLVPIDTEKEPIRQR